MDLGQLIEKVKKLKEKRKRFDILIQEAKNKGMDTSFSQVTLTVLEEVIPCLEKDIEEEKFPKAEFILNYLDESSQKAIEEAKNLLEGKKKELKVPRYDFKNLRIRDGFFYKGNEPVIVLGVLPDAFSWWDHPSVPTAEKTLLRSKDYGFGITEFYDMGARRVFPKKGQKIDPIVYGDFNYPVFLSKVEKGNLPFFLLLPIHYPFNFPD